MIRPATSSEIKAGPTGWFSLLNCLTLAAVFGTRVARDSELLVLPNAEKALPLILFVNAIIITWIGGRFGGWAARLGAARLGVIVALLAAVGMAAYAIWGSALIPDVVAEDVSLADSMPWRAAVFYLLAEIPIFLAVNLVWVIADPHFSEQEFQRAGPRIAGWGAVGIALATGGILLAGAGFALWICVGAFLALAAWLAISRDWGTPPQSPTSPGAVASTGLREDWFWSRSVPFVRWFVLATIANFVLLAGFEQTVANGASHLGYSSARLGTVLGVFVCGFGVVGALFQWFGFTWLLRKCGHARLNLFAPIFMILGASILIFGASDFLLPLWTRLKLERSSTLLFNLVLAARLCGWIAEYLFNQAMLPLVYGALPTKQGLRARFFIEGPVTAITNGMVGLLLLGYFTLFKQESDEYGYKLDLLFVVTLALAGLMLYWSWRMLPEFPKVLREKVAYRFRRAVSGRRNDGVFSRAVALSDVGAYRADPSDQSRTRFWEFQRAISTLPSPEIIARAKSWLADDGLAAAEARVVVRYLVGCGLDGMETAIDFLRQKLETCAEAEKWDWHLAAVEAGSVKSLQAILDNEARALPADLDWTAVVRLGVTGELAEKLLKRLLEHGNRLECRKGAEELLRNRPELAKEVIRLMEERPGEDTYWPLIVAHICERFAPGEPGSAKWLADRMILPAGSLDRRVVAACYDIAAFNQGEQSLGDCAAALVCAKNELKQAVSDYSNDREARDWAKWQEVRSALVALLQVEVCARPEIAPLLPPDLAFKLLGERRTLADYADPSASQSDNAFTVLEQSNIPRKDFIFIQSLVREIAPPPFPT